MYAVIETGGKQYRLQVGDVVEVERLSVEPGQAFDLEKVLMVGGDDGIKLGQPLVSGAIVRTTVVDHGKGDKVIAFKYKPKVRYRRRLGHRQLFTRLSVQEIIPGD